MSGMLVAYDAAGVIIATTSFAVSRDDDGNVLGVVDFQAHEDAGGDNLAIWKVGSAVGSKVWPEGLGGSAHQFRVELAGPAGNKHIAALIHKDSGHRRERAAAIPGKVRLDDQGRNAPPRPKSNRPALPLVARK